MATTSKLLLADLISDNPTVPSNYIRPVSDRPNLVVVSGASIPLIDLSLDRSDVVHAIGAACRTDGFFQVKNHGIPDSVVDDMLRVSKEFFAMPEQKRMKCYSTDPLRPTRLSTSFNVNTEEVSNWRDYLRLHCYPLEDFVPGWPSNPPSFKRVVGDYCTHVRLLALRLLQAISQSLGLEPDYLARALGKHAQHMAINYYPPCPQPDLTYGLPAHKDPNAITVLLQDGVSGLQVLKDGSWVAVDPIPRTFVVNIGDQVQALSNGRYRSALHRAVVNRRSERISVPTFYSPSPEAVIGPAEGLVDVEHPGVYKSFTYGEYYDKFWNHGLKLESCLDMFKVAN